LRTGLLSAGRRAGYECGQRAERTHALVPCPSPTRERVPTLEAAPRGRGVGGGGRRRDALGIGGRDGPRPHPVPRLRRSKRLPEGEGTRERRPGEIPALISPEGGGRGSGALADSCAF